MSRPTFITIRGYAIPFDRPKLVDRDRPVEIIDRAAFDGMLADRHRVAVLWDTHDEAAAIRLVENATLFADDYGIGFSARVDFSKHWGLVAAMMRRKAPIDQCSIGGFEIAAQHPDIFDGMPVSRVVAGTFDHITITAHAAYGMSTAVWPSHVSIEDAPLRIQEMSARWLAGREVSKLVAKRRQLLAASDTIMRANARTDADLSVGQYGRIVRNVVNVDRIDIEIERLRRVSHG